MNRARISRKVFLFFHLFFIMILVTGILFSSQLKLTDEHLDIVVFCFAMLFWILSIYRFHDINKSGWYVLGLLVPIYNLILLYDLYFERGTLGNNYFGPDPLYSSIEIKQIKKIEEFIYDNSTIEDVSNDYYLKERENFNHYIKSNKFALRDDILEVIASKKELFFAYFLTSVPIFTVILLFITAFILKSWLILVAIPLVLIGYILNSPFLFLHYIYNAAFIIALFFSIKAESLTFIVVSIAGIITIISLKLLRIFVHDIIIRRAYYSFNIYHMIKKLNYFMDGERKNSAISYNSIK